MDDLLKKKESLLQEIADLSDIESEDDTNNLVIEEEEEIEDEGLLFSDTEHETQKVEPKKKKRTRFDYNDNTDKIKPINIKTLRGKKEKEKEKERKKELKKVKEKEDREKGLVFTNEFKENINDLLVKVKQRHKMNLLDDDFIDSAVNFHNELRTEIETDILKLELSKTNLKFLDNKLNTVSNKLNKYI